MSGETAKPVRQKVVLAQRRGARSVRARVEVAEQTEVGEVLVRGLMRAQLTAALARALPVTVVVAALPALAAATGGGAWWWLALGLLAYPALFLVGWRHTRHAERVEQDFAELVER